MNSAPDDLPSPGHHLTTASHDGRFWDVYLEFEEHRGSGDRFRAVLAFSPVDRAEGERTLRTIPVIVEDTYDEVVQRARLLDDHQLSAFLRSLLP
jgi:hypothetical protein